MTLDFGPFVFGGNVIGWTADRETSFRILDAFVEGGGRAIDTADVYAEWAGKGGVSEEILGEWMESRGNRSKLVIATKVAKSSARRGLAAKNIRAAIEDSLRRLRTDYVDLYYAHEDDASVPQSEYLGALDVLVKEGKVRVLGASNFTPARLSSALAFCRQNGLARFEVSQDQWSLVARGIEQTLVPVLAAEGLRELPYWALAGGFLTGKYRPGREVDSARAKGASEHLKKPENLRLLTRLDELAEAHEASVAAIALAWLRAQPTVGAPLASARTVEQLGPLFESATLKLDAEELDSLSTITAR